MVSGGSHQRSTSSRDTSISGSASSDAEFLSPPVSTSKVRDAHQPHHSLSQGSTKYGYGMDIKSSKHVPNPIESENIVSSIERPAKRKTGSVDLGKGTSIQGVSSSDEFETSMRRPRRIKLTPAEKEKAKKDFEIEKARKDAKAEKQAVKLLEHIKVDEKKMRRLIPHLEECCAFVKARITFACCAIGGPCATSFDEITPPVTLDNIVADLDPGMGEYELERIVKRINDLAVWTVAQHLNLARIALVQLTTRCHEWLVFCDAFTLKGIEKEYGGHLMDIDLNQRYEECIKLVSAIVIEVDAVLIDTEDTLVGLQSDTSDAAPDSEELCTLFSEMLNSKPWRGQDRDIVNVKCRQAYAIALKIAMNMVMEWRMGLQDLRKTARGLLDSSKKAVSSSHANLSKKHAVENSENGQTVATKKSSRDVQEQFSGYGPDTYSNKHGLSGSERRGGRKAKVMEEGGPGFDYTHDVDL